MATQRTLAIVKPDATAKPGATGEILRRAEDAGLRVIALRMVRLTEGLARGFYAVHKERPFFGDLVKFMTSGPVVVCVFEGEDAIARWRGPGWCSRPATSSTCRGNPFTASFSLLPQCSISWRSSASLRLPTFR